MHTGVQRNGFEMKLSKTREKIIFTGMHLAAMQGVFLCEFQQKY